MNAPRAPYRRLFSIGIAGSAALVLLGGCMQGDYGRVPPSLVSDGIHDWLGQRAAFDAGRIPSSLPLTDDERELRDLAFPLIEAPYNRDRWDQVLREYGVVYGKHRRWPPFDVRAYSRRLLGRPDRSTQARYARLIDDVRDDVTRVGSFVPVASRVLAIDRKRGKAMAYFADLPAPERVNARRRIAENALIIAWVRHSVRERIAAYRYALERCVVATPSPMAAEAEQAIDELQQRISRRRLVLRRPAITVAAG